MAYIEKLNYADAILLPKIKVYVSSGLKDKFKLLEGLGVYAGEVKVRLVNGSQ